MVREINLLVVESQDENEADIRELLYAILNEQQCAEYKIAEVAAACDKMHQQIEERFEEQCKAINKAAEAKIQNLRRQWQRGASKNARQTELIRQK